MRYKVLMIPHGGGGFTAVVPTLPGVVTEGESYADALDSAREAARLAVRVMNDHGEDIPTEPEGTAVAEIEVEMPIPAGVG